MSYNYQAERPKLFTEEGIAQLLKTRDLVRKFISQTGAFTENALIPRVTGDSWTTLACLDYMIERKEIHRITDGNGFRVYFE